MTVKLTMNKLIVKICYKKKSELITQTFLDDFNKN